MNSTMGVWLHAECACLEAIRIEAELEALRLECTDALERDDNESAFELLTRHGIALDRFQEANRELWQTVDCYVSTFEQLALERQYTWLPETLS
jgi:hypothetical protein